MKVIFTIIGVVMVLLLFGTMMGGITEAQTDERTDAFGAIVTGGGDVDAAVVLVGDLYGNDILNVTSVTSDLVTDVPLVSVYVPGTNTLTIIGLTASDTRTLTVIYLIDALTASPGVSTFFGLLPLLVVIALVVVVVAGMIVAFKNR